MTQSLKLKIIGFIIALGLLLLAIFQGGFYLSSKEALLHLSSKIGPSSNIVSEEKNPEIVGESSEPQIISVKPENLNGSTVSPTQVIEITFNQSTQGFDPKVHIQFDPKVEYLVEQSNDHKTIMIKPEKLYAVGTEYKLKVMSNLEFSDKKKLGEDKEYRFKTIEYRGI